MYIDVIDLKDFYSGQLGRTAHRLIGHKLRARWPDAGGETVVALGYGPPYLEVFLPEAERVAALMPAAQGVVHWPAAEPYRVALCHDDAMPLPDESVERLLLIHALEMSEGARGLLREVWRVLAPGGSLIAVVPNRRGMWARFDTTPFGHGRPFSRAQLTSLLRDSMFSPSGWVPALFMPPFNVGFLRRSAAAWERLGARFTPGFAGVLIVEATKQVYQPIPVRGERRLQKAFAPALARREML